MKFFDLEIEKRVLAAFLKGPQYWQNIARAWFYTPISAKAYEEFQKFLEPPYLTYPTATLVEENTADIEVKLFTIELENVAVDLTELPIYLHKLYEMYAARRIRDITQTIPNELHDSGIEEVIRRKISQLTEINDPFATGTRLRGFIYDDLDEDRKYYTDIERDPTLRKTTPYNIDKLDMMTAGGLHEGDIVLLYGGTGGYKTMTKANLAYNFAFCEHKHVMVLTLEVKMSDYRRIIEARHSRLNYDLIREGRLEHMRNIFFNSLTDIQQTKPSLYMVDIPDRATSADVTLELDEYRAKTGFYPDILIIDYLNEMEPVTRWGNTSEKFKNLGVELRRIIRSHEGMSLITSMQENRKGAESKDKENVGLETIGESHYMSNVCSLIIHLYQSSDGIDTRANILNMAIRKSRWGPKHEVFQVEIDPQFKFIGDRDFLEKELRKRANNPG